MPPAITNKSFDINPAPPLGLGYIASILESMGIAVKIVDCLLEGWNNRVQISSDHIRVGLSEKEIEKIIIEYKPDIVSVNSQFTRQFKNAHAIYRIAKEADIDIITIAGGAHPTVLPEFELQDPNLDFVILGEGEKSIKELLLALSHNSKSIPMIDGIGYKSHGVIHIHMSSV